MIRPPHFRIALWLFFYSNVILQFIWYGWWVPARLAFPIAISIAVLPLLPGLLLHLIKNRYAIVWAGFGMLLHFTFAAMEVLMAGANRKPAIVSSFICCGFFLCWNFLVVGEKRARRRVAAQSSEPI